MLCVDEPAMSACSSSSRCRKTAELKHARLAMVAVAIAIIKTAVTRDGSLVKPLLNLANVQ